MSRVEFVEPVNFRAPRGFRSALARAAEKERTTASEMLRRAALRDMRAAGVEVATTPDLEGE